MKTRGAHIPFVVVGPHIHSQTADVPRLEEGERRLGRCHLHGHALVLRGDQKKVNIYIFATLVANLEELLDYEGCLDRRNAARCDEKNVCVSFAPVFCCGEILSHV